jgi:hypothetical protein
MQPNNFTPNMPFDQNQMMMMQQNQMMQQMMQ